MSKRILVVEDQEDNRQILRDLLGSAGYEMTEAWDGEASVSAAKEQRPDLILMDIQLPHMDGYEATRRIKADPELKGIPIIAVTSYALSGDDGCRLWMVTRREDEAIEAIGDLRELLEEEDLLLPDDRKR